MSGPGIGQVACCKCQSVSSELLVSRQCRHLLCVDCMSRLFAIQARIGCPRCSSVCVKKDFSQIGPDSAQTELEFFGSLRRKVCDKMQFSRAEFTTTPDYDEFLEQREDLINRFLSVGGEGGSSSSIHSSSSSSIHDRSQLRAQLQQELDDFERKNQTKLVALRSGRVSARLQEIKEIVDEEGLMYAKLNVPVAEKDSVTSHPLSEEMSSLQSVLQESSGMNKNAQSSHLDFDPYSVTTRWTRILEARAVETIANQEDGLGHMNQTSDAKPKSPRSPVKAPVVSTFEKVVVASGCKDLWKVKAHQVLFASLQRIS